MTTYYGFYDATGEIYHASSIDETQFPNNDVSTTLANVGSQPQNAGLTLYTNTTTPFTADDHYLVIDNTTTPATVTLTTRPLLTAICQWNKTIVVDANGQNTVSMSANGTDTLTLSAIPTTGSPLPNPTPLYMQVPDGLGVITHQNVNITDGSFNLTIPSSGAGVYKFVFTVFPYQDYTLTVTAS